MFDTMTLTKVTSAVCGALLVLLLGKWVAEEIYHVGGHGEASYVIEVETAATAEPEQEIDFTAMLAEADISKGAGVFRKCTACHKLEDGANGTGPHLFGIVGRPKAAVDGFNYSSALSGLEGDWTPENLNGFLEKPSAYAKGTSMSFAGLKKIQDRANLIAYLDSLNN